MYYSTRLQIGTALLLASLCTVARASGDDPAAAPPVCTGEYRIVFSAEGRSGERTPFVRQEQIAPACASASMKPLVLTVFTDAAGGSVLLTGAYDAAIAEIRATKRVPAVKSLKLSNLCVAQIVARDWLEARGSCDAAVEAARIDKAGSPTWPASLRDNYRAFLAVAYSNRAVLSILAQDVTAGKRDLALAKNVAPRAQFVKRNLEASRLDARVAQVEVR